MANREAPSPSGHHLLGPPPRRLRDRRGRGIRGQLIPASLPAYRTRADRFDAVVAESFTEIDARWHDHLTGLDVAVDDIPRILPRGDQPVQWPDDVTADGQVPLARFIPKGVDLAGNPTRAQIILFRRPLELRAHDAEELPEILREVLIEQVAVYLGVDEETIESGPDSD
ncbi:metallopeptidase family protein [Gordonia sp. (in: high G+C Gram-positive bacteria)]|uniref:metallopeptidase family protein n=1 Tax=Gordonia sp. (in: high G+C Gram-positive bacteria) TaxID=84139 RepID=UPI003C718B67